MPSRTITPEEQQVKQRFLEAMYMCIGKRIVKTKKELAEAIGMSPSNLRRLEDIPNCSVSAHNLVMICKLGVNAEWLLLGKGEMFN